MRPMKKSIMLCWVENRRLNMDESANLDYWKQVNVRTAEYESVVSQGSWLEADLLDEADD